MQWNTVTIIANTNPVISADKWVKALLLSCFNNGKFQILYPYCLYHAKCILR